MLAILKRINSEYASNHDIKRSKQKRNDQNKNEVTKIKAKQAKQKKNDQNKSQTSKTEMKRLKQKQNYRNNRN